MIAHSLYRYRDLGLLILRVGIGIMFMCHGYPKLMAGPETWMKIGGAMSSVGIDFVPTFWGFMAALSEFGGGLILTLGLFTRLACFLLFSTMLVAALMHITQGDPFGKYSHALESSILFFSLYFIGPGKFSMDEKLQKKRDVESFSNLIT